MATSCCSSWRMEQNIHCSKVGLCTERGYDSHTGGVELKKALQLKVSTFNLSYCFISSPFSGAQSQNNKKYVTVPILTSCTVQNYKPSNNRGIESASLCQCLKKQNCTSGATQSWYLAELSFRNHLYPRPAHIHADTVVLRIKSTVDSWTMK